MAFYALTSSPDEEIEAWRDRTGAEYPFCQMDDITLKTIIRSNPGLLLIKDGTILNKWSDSQFPDEYVLNDSLDKVWNWDSKTGKQFAYYRLRIIVVYRTFDAGSRCRYSGNQTQGEKRIK